MAQLFALSARSALAAGITSTSTSMTVDASTADLFPVANTETGAVGTDGLDWFKVILEDADYNKEVVYVRTRALGSAIMTNLLRGQEGTTARSFLGGSVVGLRHTAVDLQDAIEFASDPRAELIEYTPAGAGAAITDVQARLRAYEASGGSALIGYQSAGTGAATTVQTKLRESVSVKDFGAKGDGVTNDTSAIQTAIDYLTANGGGAINFSNGVYLANIVLKNGVTLQSNNRASPGVSWGSYKPVLIKGYTTATVIDTPSTAIGDCGILNIAVTGVSGFSDIGIRFRNVNFSFIRDVTVTNTLNEGILIEAGVACEFQNILCTDALKTRTRLSRTGAVTVNGTDHFLYAIEAQVGNQNYGDRQSSANRYLAGLHIKGSNHFVTSCIGELSDVGIVVEGMLHSVVGCRGDLNNGEGFIVIGSAQFVGCRAINNSKGSTNTGVSISGVYSGFYADCQSSIFTNCNSIQTSTYTTKYSFEDVSQNSEQFGKNIWSACNGNGYANDLWYLANEPSRVNVVGGQASVTLSTGSNTLDVTSVSVLFVDQAAGGAAAIDYLVGGVPLQEVTLVVSAATNTVTVGNTWFVATGGMRTNSEPSSKTLNNKRSYKFVRVSSFWTEV